VFTGLVETVGEVVRIERGQADARLTVNADLPEPKDLTLGDSVAVNGVCLTVVEISGREFSFDMSAETLACTTSGDLTPGRIVNLERALLPSTRLGGHIVSGHVDGIAQIVGIRPRGESTVLRIRVPDGLARYVAGKGSVTLDGISLTVNVVEGSEFEVNIIPHTMEMTHLKVMKEGSRLNIEVDLIARYLERLLQVGQPDGDGHTPASGLPFGALD